MGHSKIICTECGQEAFFFHSVRDGRELWSCANGLCNNCNVTEGTDEDNKEFGFKTVGWISAGEGV